MLIQYVNMIHILISVFTLSHLYKLELGLEGIIFVYIVKLSHLYKHVNMLIINVLKWISL